MTFGVKTSIKSYKDIYFVDNLVRNSHLFNILSTNFVDYSAQQYCRLEFHFKFFDTGKSLSEALIFASTNPQYDDRLFIEL